MSTLGYAVSVFSVGVVFGVLASFWETGSIWPYIATGVPLLLTLLIAICSSVVYAVLKRWIQPVAASWVLVGVSFAAFGVLAFLSTGPGDLALPSQWVGYAVTFSLFSAPLVITAVASVACVRRRGKAGRERTV